MYHGFDTQKNESMNQKIAKMCPKSPTLSKTMVLSDRVSWVVIKCKEYHAQMSIDDEERE